MNLLLRTQFLLLIILFLNGCASTPHNQRVELQQLGVEYVDADYKVIVRNDLPKEVFISFPVIPGAVAGNILTEGQISKVADIGGKFSLDVEKLTEKVKRYATPLLATAFNSGITITPKHTKLLRVGTFAYDPSTANFLGPTGLALQNSDIHQLFMVYFDRPSTLKGSLMEGENLVKYDVKVDIAGLSWLKVVVLESGIMEITKHNFTGNEIIIIQATQIDGTKA